MSEPNCVRMGVVIASADPYAHWYGEVLRQIGFVFELGGTELLDRISEFDVILLAGRGSLNFPYQQVVRKWLNEPQNQLILSGGFWNFEHFFGFTAPKEFYSRGKFCPPKSSAISPLAEDCFGGAFFGGQKAFHLTGSVWAADDEGNPLVSRSEQVSVFVPHIGQTAALMLLGHGVSNDLIGPGDGSCFMEDGVQRSEDGTNFQWSDREILEPGIAPAFLRPHFDELREQFARLILNVIESTGKEAVVLWHLPANADSACTLSVDCDDSDQDLYRRISISLGKFGYRPAWMIPPPGLPQDMYRAFKGWGHDIGHLYRQDTEHASEDQVRMQNTQLARGVGDAHLTILKGWDGAWYGLTRNYRLAEASGAWLSLCKGGRQAGTSGFLFGTSRPFIPHGKKRAYKVVEIPSLAYAPGFVTHGKVAFRLLQSAKRHHGVFQFSFLASHGHDDRLETQLGQIFIATRDAGMTIFPPSVIGDYERNRRKVSVDIKPHGLRLVSETAIPGLTVMVSGQSRLSQLGRSLGASTIDRYGKTWQVVTVKLEPRMVTEIEVTRSRAA
ncbi:MAG: hypothetical protein KF824_09705 [Fimbriimonadaceae bacterium]|nr:MAG: hypothetical protein KF824_09705 [Fimbriimonadaceae bacterium]